MIKVMLIVWIGYGQNQVLDIERMDSMVECNAAKTAMIEQSYPFDGSWVKCVEYKY